MSMDLHVPQLQGFFNIPVDHLLGSPMLAHYFKDRIEEREENVDDYVVVSPDLGSVTRARTFAARIGCPLAIVDKRRQKANVSEVMNIIGDVRGKKVILVDDMIDTAGTLCNSATAILEKGEQPKWLPAPPTAFCPAQPLSASKTARSKRLFCWIPSRCRQRKELIKSTCFPWLLCLRKPSAASTRTSRFPLCLNRMFQRFPLLQSHGCSMAFSFCFPLDFVKPDNRRKQGNAQSPTCPPPRLCGIITWKCQRNRRFREFLRALNHKKSCALYGVAVLARCASFLWYNNLETPTESKIPGISQKSGWPSFRSRIQWSEIRSLVRAGCVSCVLSFPHSQADSCAGGVSIFSCMREAKPAYHNTKTRRGRIAISPLRRFFPAANLYFFNKGINYYAAFIFSQ